MKVHDAVDKLKHADRGLIADLLLALAAGIAFAAFSMTVMQMDSMAGSTRAFPPGRIVYM